MTTLYIVRHGQTLLNQLNRAQGWSDSPLTSEGEQTAKNLGENLIKTSFHAVYCSDTIRATQTAEIMLTTKGQTDIKIHQDSRLREWCLGSMEAENNTIFIKEVTKWLGGNVSFTEMNQRLPEVAEAIKNHDMTGCAEPFKLIRKRLLDSLISAVGENEEGSNILIVSHAFCMKTLLYLFDLEHMEEHQKIENASVFKIYYDGNKFTM